MNKVLTKKTAPDIFRTIRKFHGAVPSLRKSTDAERGFLVLGQKPECLHAVRHGGGFREAADNTRAFLFYARKSKNLRRCTMPEKWYLPEDVRDLADSLENLAALTIFLEESFSYKDPINNFSTKGEWGICLLLGLFQDVLEKGNQILLKEVK